MAFIGIASLTVIIISLGFLDWLGLVIYIPIVLQNITFTFNELPLENIPFYSGSLGTSTTTRYDYNWWEFASDGLRIFPPAICFACIMFQLVLRPHRPLGYVIANSIFMIIEIIKSIKRTVNWAECSNYQFCRNFDTNQNPGSINYVFLTCNIYGYIYILFSIAFLAFLPVIEISSRHYHTEEKHRQEVLQDNIAKLCSQTDISVLAFSQPGKKKKTRSR